MSFFVQVVQEENVTLALFTSECRRVGLVSGIGSEAPFGLAVAGSGCFVNTCGFESRGHQFALMERVVVGSCSRRRRCHDVLGQDSASDQSGSTITGFSMICK